MTEKEIIDLLVQVKDKLISLKEEKKNLQDRCNQLQGFCDNMQNELNKVTEQNGIYKSDIVKLQEQLDNIQKQSQQSQESDKNAKDAFMQELSRVLKEANEAVSD